MDDDGLTVAQIQSLARANDPIYELGFRIVGSTQGEDLDPRSEISSRPLRRKRAGDIGESVRRSKGAVVAGDERLAKCGARSMLYTMATPIRWIRSLIGRRTP